MTSLPPGLSPLELVSGLVMGHDHAAGVGSSLRGPVGTPALDPAEALEDAVRPALRNAPCLVSFSGGLDSALVLAVADRLARREGLSRPVPVTFRFPAAARAQEDGPQDAVVAALGCQDWERISVTDELALLGPVARAALRRHGVRHPANAFLHLPLLERTRGGSLLTGIGGDQVLGGWRRLARRRPWRPRPGRGQRTPDLDWLRPGLQRRLRRQLSRERSSQPTTLTRRMAWHLDRRDLRLTLETMDVLASDTGTLVVSPLTDRRFADALARGVGDGEAPPPGVAGRPALLAAVFEDLPPAVTARRDKATFGEVFWRPSTLDLLGSWDGGGIDDAVVDPSGLRRVWSEPLPSFLTALLAQHLWLGGHLTENEPRDPGSRDSWNLEAR